MKVQRGGSYLCTDQYCSRHIVGTRGKGDIGTGTNHLGFRCVMTRDQWLESHQDASKPGLINRQFHFQDCHLRQLDWMHSGAIFGQYGMRHAGARITVMRSRVNPGRDRTLVNLAVIEAIRALLTILGFNRTTRR
jgi:hypothetical protein